MKNNQSKQYVLQALDKWYVERLKENYTEEDAENLMKKTVDIFKDTDEERYFQMKELAPKYFSLEGQIKTSENIFSKSYEILESVINKNEFLGVGLDNLDESEKNRCIKHGIDSYRQIMPVIDSLRKKFDAKFPDELTKEDVESSLKQVFKGSEGFADFYGKLFDTIVSVLSIQAEKGEIPTDTFISIETILKSGKPCIINLMKRMAKGLDDIK